MKTCLEKCLELSVTSISFPVLENRKFSMDKAAVAKIMFDEVVKFAKDKLKRQLTVKFVIFPGELDTYKVRNILYLSYSSFIHITSFSHFQSKTQG